MYKEIGFRLKKARKKMGFQQQEIAGKLGISRAGYSRIETGHVEITTKNLLKIAEILQISMDWLLFGIEVDQTKQTSPGFFADFGKYAGSVELMFASMKENESTMHSLLSSFFTLKGREAVENRSQKEKEKEQHV